MWKIDISGKKKAVLLAWTCVIGYEEPEIEYESGTDEAFFLSCSVNTRNDANPFGDTEAVWDGRKADLSQFDEMDIREVKHSLFLNGVGLKQLTGYLSVDIEMKNIPEGVFLSGTLPVTQSQDIISLPFSYTNTR